MRNRGRSLSFGALGLCLVVALLAVLAAAPAIAGTVNFGPSGTFSKIGTGNIWDNNNLRVYNDPIAGPVLFALFNGQDNVKIARGLHDGNWWGPSRNVAGMMQEIPSQALTITTGPVLHVFASYHDAAGTPRVHYSKSVDSGAWWSTPAAINPATECGENNYLRATSDSAGNLYAVWEGSNTGSSAYLSYSTDDGNTWSQETVSNNYWGGIAIAVDPSNNIYVTWQDTNSISWIKKGALIGGYVQWLTETQLPSASGTTVGKLAVYDSDHIYFLSVSNAGTLCNFTSDGGLHWGSTVAVPFFGSTSLAVAPNGNVGITWATNEGIVFERSIDGCQRFRDSGFIAEEEAGQFMDAELAFDPNSKALVMLLERDYSSTNTTAIQFKKEQ